MEIGKLACNIGATATARRISKKFEDPGTNESTVCGFKKAYLNELREEEDLNNKGTTTQEKR